MTILKFSAYIVFGFFLFLSCNERITTPPVSGDDDNTVLVSTYGQEDRFEIATWNLENFPKDGKTTVNSLGIVIENLDIDLFAVEEISNTSMFDSLVSKLPGWKGVLTDYSYSNGTYQKTGFLYKSGFISLSNIKSLSIDAYTEYGDAFPRPPFSAYVQVKDLNGTPFDFNLIVIHLKAYSGIENEVRRRLACELLEDYINTEINNGADPDFIVLGDWNDSITDDPESNVFTVFLDQPQNYTFLTQSLGDQYSYIDERYRSLIDHILITNDVLGEYQGGITEVLYLDEEYAPYPMEISDHRPVMAAFNGFSLKLTP